MTPSTKDQLVQVLRYLDPAAAAYVAEHGGPGGQLPGSFVFARSPQGVDYWWALHHRITALPEAFRHNVQDGEEVS